MKPRFSLASAALAILGASVATMLPLGAGAAEPPPDVTGEYVGKGAYKINIINGEEPGKGKLLFDVMAVQTGNDLTLTVTTLDEEGEVTFNLTGRVGNGHWWATSSSEDEQYSFTGTARGKPGKLSLKGKGWFMSDTHYSDVKFAVKQVIVILE